MASKEEIIAKTNAAREARKLLRDREAAAIQIQVNNFHKVYHFIKEFDRLFYKIHEIKDVKLINSSYL